MKKVTKYLVVVVCLMMITGLVYAGEPGGGNDPQGEKDMDHGMMSRHGMMPMMMQKSMVASSDGGVIVLAGNKLQKYDKNLNLKKEVELASDMPGGMPGMMGMMSGMKKQCPVMGSSDAEGKSESKK